MDGFVRNFIDKYARIIRKSKPEYLLKLLSAIEYTEAILEMTSAKLFGDKFKWFIVLITQLSKCIIKLVLLAVHKIGIHTLPSLFNIKKFLDTLNDEKKENSNSLLQTNDQEKSGYYKLQHSGRIIRTIKNSPSNTENRDWTLPIEPKETQLNGAQYNLSQDKYRMIAETLYIIRPICHLTSIFVFNTKSWKQYVVALALDTISIFMMNGTKNLTKSQVKEMRRRVILLLHYLIRSPLYDFYTSSIINVALNQMEQHLPLVKYIIKPIKNYIPYWQSIYSYCWTS